MNHPPPIPSKKNQTNKNTPTSCNGKQSNNGIVLSCLFFLASVEISLTTYRPNFLLKKNHHFWAARACYCWKGFSTQWTQFHASYYSDDVIDDRLLQKNHGLLVRLSWAFVSFLNKFWRQNLMWGLNFLFNTK